ncbi:MAG: DUF86 domain-containing protein [Candidatus Methanoperedens sp.]|nr:DUF86 domain-containing protein [Candidatus Methanoperedens sp.]MCZ7403299.1 DUF86 domain-containing protein [Candidatus Methanoperedens sp.]
MRTEIIRTKIAEIKESRELIRENLPDSFEEFASLGLLKDGMYKRIEFCIENVFDICAIINTDLRLGIPRSDDDILEILVRKGIFDDEMRAKLKGMKGFRNIIVHRYAGIDDRLSYEFFSEKLVDFEEFVGKIVEFMNRKSKL